MTTAHRVEGQRFARVSCRYVSTAAGRQPARVLQRVVRRHDGSETHAPLGIRLAQVVHHGTDHRSQICTALTNLGIAPPGIDAWDYAASDGRLAELPAPVAPPR
ncbi:MAG TPA: DinB family protein [Candidatus Acidoferrum sp.]|nr:DinB family protein [Candidatus Acidoferrum sp.]